MATSTAHPRRRRTSSLSRSIETLEQRLLMARLVGIDTSTYQPNVNWATVKNVGLKDFAIVRATAGLTTNDSQFLNNVNTSTGVAANGMYVGFYHYAYYDTDETHTAIAEADHFFDRVKNYLLADGKHLMPVLDVEQPLRTGWTGTELSQWITDWCQRVTSRALSEKGLVITPIIYAGAYNAGGQMNNTICTYYPDWIPAWPSTLPNPQTAEPSNIGLYQEWSFWQYAGGATGTCPGVGNGTTTPCDLDVFQGDHLDIKDYIIGSEGRWADNTWVQINNSGGLKAWNDSTCNSSAPWSDTSVTVPNGTIGKILEGPIYGNGYMRYRVQYNTGTTGWAAGYFLDTVQPGTPSNPNVSGTVTSLPTNFTWTAAANASSYDVYLDGVFKANVTTNSWAHGAISLGGHTWQVVAKNGEFSASVAPWTFTLDDAAPSATYGNLVPTPGSANFDFTIVYVDGFGVDVSSLGTGDVTVSGPNGYSQTATFISVDVATNGSPRVATYRIPGPGGTWDIADNGTYTVTQVANEVRDITNNYRPAGAIGTFTFGVAFAYKTGTTLNVAFDGTSMPIGLGTSGSTINAMRNGTTLPFTGITAVNVLGTSGQDNLQIFASIAPPITYGGVSGNDTLAITAGTYTFSSDIGPLLRTVAVTIDGGAVGQINSTQHLRGMTVNGTAGMAADGTLTLITNALSVNGSTGSFDIKDNAVVVDYAASSPLGSWNGSKYTGVTGQIVNGRNGGAWNGKGIVTSMTDAQGPGTLTTIGITEAALALNLGVGQTAVWRNETIDATSVLARYTYAGDADLDGTINGDDYFLIDAGISAGAKGYGNGDFNYDGRIDADDYFLIDSNLNDADAAPLSSAAPAGISTPPATLFARAPIASAYDLLEQTDALELI